MAIVSMKKFPGILAFRRSHVLSDALMFSRMRNGAELPVNVIQHGVRGSQNVNDGKGNERQQKSTLGTRNVSNIQITESAKLHADADALVIRFSLSMLDLDQALHSCASSDRAEGRNMRESIDNFILRAKASDGLYQVALRYARNIANGRWLWRNRSIAANVEIIVSRRDGTFLSEFDAFAIPSRHFDSAIETEHLLATELAAQMAGKSTDGLVITATLALRVKGSVEVFPSQNYAEKPRGFSRSLYKIGSPDVCNFREVQASRQMGHAALRDQKVFNAIRTIDTWYPDFEMTATPIPIEPLGANLAHQEFYRPGKYSSFELFKRLIEIDPNSADGMFCIAALDRGGVYGEADKGDKADKGEKVEEQA